MDSEQLLINKFIRDHSADAALVLERLAIEEAAAFLEDIPPRLAQNIFLHLERFTAVKCLEILGTNKAAAIIESLPIEVSATFLRRMPKEMREAALQLLKKEISAPLQNILAYPEDTAGSIADPLVFTLPVDITAKEALKRVHKRPERVIYYLYIINRNQTFAGVINIRELMLAPPGAKMPEIIKTDVNYISADANLQAVSEHPGWLDFHALPVVDRDGFFIGAIQYETLLRLEQNKRKRRIPKHAITAGNALGELYRIAISGLLQSTAEGLPGSGK